MVSGPTGASGAVARQRPAAARAAPGARMLGAARPRPPAPPPPPPPGALRGLYARLDALPVGRRKRHLARDFSDGGEGPGAGGPCPGVQAESPALVRLGQREPRGLVGGTARRRPPRAGLPAKPGRPGPRGGAGGPLPRWPWGGGVGRQGWGQEFLTPHPRLPRGSPSSSSEPAGPHGPPAGAPTPCGGSPGPPSIPLRVEALGDECCKHPGALGPPHTPARRAPVMLAEVVKLFRPRLVVPTCSSGQKRSNWNVLNRQGSERGFPPRLACGAHSSLREAGLRGRPPRWGQVLRLHPCRGLP